MGAEAVAAEEGEFGFFLAIAPVLAAAVGTAALGKRHQKQVISSMPYLRDETLYQLAYNRFRTRNIRNSALREIQRRQRGGRRQSWPQEYRSATPVQEEEGLPRYEPQRVSPYVRRVPQLPTQTYERPIQVLTPQQIAARQARARQVARQQAEKARAAQQRLAAQRAQAAAAARAAAQQAAAKPKALVEALAPRVRPEVAPPRGVPRRPEVARPGGPRAVPRVAPQRVVSAAALRKRAVLGAEAPAPATYTPPTNLVAAWGQWPVQTLVAGTAMFALGAWAGPKLIAAWKA
jgi:translation initiation factor IF-2